MTLRGPDFLNRMTLFVARCMQDGVWDAFSLDSENNLVYDWTKDKRFSIFASGSTDHKDYKKQINKIDYEEGLYSGYCHRSSY